MFVSVGPNRKVAYRGRFLEWGTSKMPPHPFIEKVQSKGGTSCEDHGKNYPAPIK
ncbi:HK97-gp10 family putative phage morphogenesis protein [Bacillus safensis]|uniref:HK97-gp10 family putative phage morphogenesis protein n=1 Tax=Bacillus safensis TaxID=561879 RepID=UPI001E5BE02E|nr:HK97-gp10 family putative phage morphogenesis protein [Bacillus safensis]